jgi:hypothetical protein
MIGGVQQWDLHEEKFQTQLETYLSKISNHMVNYLKIMYHLTMTLDLSGEDLLELVVDLWKKEFLMVVVDPLVVAMDPLVVMVHMEGEDL